MPFETPQATTPREVITPLDWAYVGKYADNGDPDFGGCVTSCEACKQHNLRHRFLIANKHNPDFTLWVGSTCIRRFVGEEEFERARGDQLRMEAAARFDRVLENLRFLESTNLYPQMQRIIGFYTVQGKFAAADLVWVLDRLAIHRRNTGDIVDYKVRRMTNEESRQLIDLDYRQRQLIYPCLTAEQMGWLSQNQIIPDPMILAAGPAAYFRFMEDNHGDERRRLITAKREQQATQRRRALAAIQRPFEQARIRRENVIRTRRFEEAETAKRIAREEAELEAGIALHIEYYGRLQADQLERAERLRVVREQGRLAQLSAAERQREAQLSAVEQQRLWQEREVERERLRQEREAERQAEREAAERERERLQAVLAAQEAAEALERKRAAHKRKHKAWRDRNAEYLTSKFEGEYQELRKFANHVRYWNGKLLTEEDRERWAKVQRLRSGRVRL